MVAALAAAFDQHLAPACRQPSNRVDYWCAWRLVITWAVARKAVPDILPMSLETLKALTWDLVCFAVLSLSQIELVLKALQASHCQFQLRQRSQPVLFVAATEAGPTDHGVTAPRLRWSRAPAASFARHRGRCLSSRSSAVLARSSPASASTSVTGSNPSD